MSEAQLATALDALDPIEFQVLAERFVRIREPSRFSRLSPVGRTAGLRPTNTWGDGRVTFSDGHIDVVEATTRSDPEQHLLEDASTIAEKLSGRVDGFVFVASGPEPSERVISDRIKRLKALGVPGDAIDLIFRQRLLRELAEPRFSVLWPELGLPSTPAPFQPIESAAQIFGDPSNPHRFIPSLKDFENGWVPWLKAHRELLAVLQESHFALVRGERGSGKTVLCAQVGLRWRDLGLPVLYLDLASSLTSYERLEEAVDSRADAGVLFVLDNIHADERRAAAIERHWRSRGDSSSLLLIGRPALPSKLGTAGPLANVPEEEMRLEVGPDAVGAVLDQEFRRHGLERPQAPIGELERWTETFGGDLICLIGAIRNRLPAIRRGEWKLAASDAVDYVRAMYLHGSEPSVNSQLATLAVMGELEVAIPEGVLSEATIEHARSQGLLKTLPDRLPGQLRYSLPHPALAALLLTAEPVDEIEVLAEVATRSPRSLSVIAARLRDRGNPLAATIVLRTAIEALGGRLMELVSVQQIAILIGSVEKHDALPLSRLDELLSEDPARLKTAVSRGTPGSLMVFMNQVKRLPMTRQILSEICDDPEIAARYAELTLRGGAQPVRHALQSWNRLGLAQMAQAQVDLLKSDTGMQSLIDDVFARGVGYIADALQISKEEGIPDIPRRLRIRLTGEGADERLAAAIQAQALAQSTYLLKSIYLSSDLRPTLVELLSTYACRKALTETMLRTNLVELNDFLSAARAFPKTEATALRVIVDPANRSRMEAAAIESPLRFLPRFLERVRSIAFDLHEAIGSALSQPEAVDQAVQRMLKQPRRLAGLRSFFKYTEIYLPETFDAFLDRLSEEGIAVPLAETAVRIERLEDLTQLLKELHELVPDAARRIDEAILTPPRIGRLHYLLYRSNSVELLDFTRTTEFSVEVWRSLPPDLWSDYCRRLGHQLHPAWELARLLEEIGCSEHASTLGLVLAEALAGDESSDLRPDLSELRWLFTRSDLTLELRIEVLEKIAARPWLQRKLQWESIEQIVPFFEACWNLDGPHSLAFLSSASTEVPVRIRISRESVDELAVALVLVGAMSTVGADAHLATQPVRQQELRRLLAQDFTPPFELDSRRCLLLLGACKLLAAHHLTLELPPGGEGYLRHLSADSNSYSPFAPKLWGELWAIDREG